MKDTYIENIAKTIEGVKAENMEQYNTYTRSNSMISKETEIKNIYINYLSKILNKENSFELARKFSKRLVEHITGNYDIGLKADFEDINENAALISSLVSTVDSNELEKEDSIETLIDGSVALGIMYEDKTDTGKEIYNKRTDENKNIFMRAMAGIKYAHEIMVQGIAKFSGFDSETNNFNDHYLRKFIGGIAFEFLSGTLIDKRHFTNVINSDIMLDKIKNEGIIHFTSLESANKIMKSGRVKASNIFDSDLTKKKSFFFAGIPKFEDFLINIPAYYVMTAVKIKPTDEQISKLKYRPLNDGAIAYDGDFTFNKENATIAYYALKYNKETNSIYIDEIDAQEAKTYKPDEEVTKSYKYKSGRNNPLNEIKLNAYGFFAEFKHYERLRKVLKTCKIENLTDDMLAEIRNIDEANVINENKTR